ncbi:hypothetical protein Pta02_29050 [Planobispora takensis]|uniref:Uncharacterized protein n=2 Tax=Planobispora takensis TaxID=1367882 RepID=A0A8J3SXC7_9ACTN|nr:hypothetical protein Pta02_29050 [Planobispora takensis]
MHRLEAHRRTTPQETEMIWFILALFAIAALAPLIGADTRDGRDWQPAEPDPYEIRTRDGRVPAFAARERTASRRPTPVIG